MRPRLRSVPRPWHHGTGISMALRPLFFSTGTAAASSSSSSSSSPGKFNSLDSRISRAGDPAGSVASVLHKWVEEGKHVRKSELQKFIKKLRGNRRFKHALEISEWMTDQRSYDISAGDIAVKLDLTCRVHGLKQAEKYFDSIPDILKSLPVYGSLLNCYAQTKCVEKAEATMQKMRDLRYLDNALPYNGILSMYYQVGKYQKLDILTKEMEENGINWDMCTYNIRLNAYAAASNVEEMEKLLMKMEADPHIRMDWHTYVAVASIYRKAGLTEKTLTMLKRSEKSISGSSRRLAYQNLLTSYAAIGKKDEVYRLWELYKKNQGSFFNAGFLCMIRSLVKFDDVDGAERIYEEWESQKMRFDIRIPNLMVSAYSGRGLWEIAEAYVEKIIESGEKPDSDTWDSLATGYRIGGQMAKLAETIKKAILTSRAGWKPNMLNLAACLEYLKTEGDVEGADELLSMVREHCHLPSGIHNKLMDYMSNGEQGTISLDLMEGNDQTRNEIHPKSSHGVEG